jgi:heme/copper-type cytochrome/quinol oxidase subunit 3
MQKTIVLGLLILAILPSLMPLWRWFLASVVIFAAAASTFFVVVANDIGSQARGEGPAGFGLMLYMGAVAVLFLGTCLVKFAVLLALFLVRRRRARKVSQAAAQSIQVPKNAA